MSIQKLIIGQWAEMTFAVGQVNNKYGYCKSIQYVQIEHKQGLNEYNEWMTTEWTYVYEVRCIDTKTKTERVINIEPHTPSLVVIWE